jgi:hypothetical protein
MSDDQQYPYGRYEYGDQNQRDQNAQNAQNARDGRDGRQDQPGSYEPGRPVPESWQGTHQPAQGPQDGDATQTWEGQTWDTRYQPHVQPHVQPPVQQGFPQAGGQAPYQAQAYGPPQAAAPGATPYPPPQNAYALPSEAPETPWAPSAPGMPGSGPSVSLPAQPSAPPSGPPPAASLDADGYSAPTTLGNTRTTGARRARTEGRSSPIIPPGLQPAGLTAVLALLLAGGAAIGPYALLVPLVLLQAVTAAGWFRLNGMWPARQGIALAFLGGLVADIALLAAGKENAAAAIIGTLGMWVLFVVVLQLRSRAVGDERMTALMATVVSAALAILATGHLAAAQEAVVVGAVAVAAATVTRALPLPGLVSVVVALLAAAGAGILAGTAATDLGAQGALLGLGAGACALVGLRAASYDYPSRFVHMTAGVALPLTVAAPAVYLLGRALA